APDHAESEIEASVDRIFDEGGSGNQIGQGIPQESRRQGKRKSVIVDAGGASHHPKKLRKDHGTPSVTSVGGKSRSMLQRLFARAMLNAEVGVTDAPTLPFVATSISTTLECEDGDHTDSVAELNLRTIGAPTKLLERSLLNLLRLVPVLLQLVELILPRVSSQILLVLFTEFNVGAARQMSLSAKVRLRAEYNIKENRRLKSVVERQGELLKVKEEEIEKLKAQLLLREAKAAEAIRLCAEASNFESVEKSIRDETNALKERNAILE
ncbi:hypothetical protein Tco_1152016, partial [Tanacetum coccineum]